MYSFLIIITHLPKDYFLTKNFWTYSNQNQQLTIQTFWVFEACTSYKLWLGKWFCKTGKKWPMFCVLMVRWHWDQQVPTQDLGQRHRQRQRGGDWGFWEEGEGGCEGAGGERGEIGGGGGGWVWEAVGSPSLWGAAVDRGSHYTATLDCPSFYSQPIIISFFSFFDGRASWGGSWIILFNKSYCSHPHIKFSPKVF